MTARRLSWLAPWIVALAACGHAQVPLGAWRSDTLSVRAERDGALTESETIYLRDDGTYSVSGAVQWGPNAEPTVSGCVMYTATHGQWAIHAQDNTDALTLQPASYDGILDSCQDPRKAHLTPVPLPRQTATYRYDIQGDRMTLESTVSPQIYLLTRVSR